MPKPEHEKVDLPCMNDLPFIDELESHGHNIHAIGRGLHDYVRKLYDGKEQPPHIALLLNFLLLWTYSSIDYTDNFTWSVGELLDEHVRRMSKELLVKSKFKHGFDVDKIADVIKDAIEKKAGIELEKEQVHITDREGMQEKINSMATNAPKGRGVLAIELDRKGNFKRFIFPERGTDGETKKADSGTDESTGST